jgi:hypothetical protein
MSDKEKLVAAVKASFQDHKAVSVTLLGAALTFSAMILASFPSYSFQLLSRSPLYFLTALTALSENLVASAGIEALTLTGLYSIVAGIAFTNLAYQMKYQRGGLKNAGLMSPGLIVSGCAGCGAGFLGLIGFAGALTLLPFKGNLVRLGGILLIIFFLGKSGDPKKCNLE